MTSEISKISKDEDKTEITKSFFQHFILLFGIVTVLLSLLFILFSGPLSLFLVESDDYKIVLAIIIAAAPFTVMYSIIESFLKAYGEIGLIVKIAVLMNLFSLAMLIPLIIFWGMFGIAIYIFIYGSLSVLIFFLTARKNFNFLLNKSSYKILGHEKLNIYKVGVVSLISSLLFQSSLILLRKMIIVHLGYEESGIYQSVLAFSQTYFMLIYVILSNYSLPQLSSLKKNEEINSELNINVRFILILLVPMIVLLFTYRTILIKLLFSSNFIKGSDLLLFQLIGDFFRVGGALFGLWLIPAVKVKQIITIDIIFNIIFISSQFVILYVYQLSIDYIPIGYFIAFSLHFSLYFFYTRKYLSFKFDNGSFKTLLTSVLILIPCLIMSKYFELYGYFINLVLMAFWIIFIVDKIERDKIIDIVRNKLRK